MTRDDFTHVLGIVRYAPPDRILITGGEPLLHPDLGWMLDRLPPVPVTIMSNGKLLDQTTWRSDVLWEVTEYPGFNDEQVARYRDRLNVSIRPARQFWDPYRDPHLDEQTARAVREKCLYQARVLGRRLYGCCLSEGIERYYGTQPVHMLFDANWQDLTRIPTWRACQHCFRAMDWNLI